MSSLGLIWSRTTFSLVAILAVSWATAQAKSCCAPQQWESNLNVISAGIDNGSPYFIQEFQNVSVDSTTHKVARIMTKITNGITSNVTVIQDFDARTEYRITNGVCKRNSLEAWTPKCIPDDAQKILTSYFGSGDKTLDFTSYLFVEGKDTYVMSVSTSDCTPLYLSVTSMLGNTPTGYTIGTYSNLTVGIKDPSVFDVPAICNHPVLHTMLKTERKQYIIDLSKKFSIVTPYTSFVAVEDRSQDSFIVGPIPSISDLVAKETVDILPYMGFDDREEEKEKEPEMYVMELLQRGEVAEGFSMVQAEETYTELDSYVPTIIKSQELIEKVYNTLQRFYSQNQAQSVGDIISQIEPALKKEKENKKRLQARQSKPSVLGRRLGFTFSNESKMETDEDSWMPIPVEMPCLQPPEVTIDLAEIEKFTKELNNLPQLPEDDDLDLMEFSPIYNQPYIPCSSIAIFDPKTRSMASKRGSAYGDKDVISKLQKQSLKKTYKRQVYPREPMNYVYTCTSIERANESGDIVSIEKAKGKTDVDKDQVGKSKEIEPLIDELLDYDDEDDVIVLNEILTEDSLCLEAPKSEEQGIKTHHEQFDIFTAEKIDNFQMASSSTQSNVGTPFGRYTQPFESYTQSSVSTPFSASNELGLLFGTIATVPGNTITSGSTHRNYSLPSPVYSPTSPAYSPTSPAYLPTCPADSPTPFAEVLPQNHAKDTNICFSPSCAIAINDLQGHGQRGSAFGTKSRWDQAEYSTSQNVEGPLGHHQASSKAEVGLQSLTGYGTVSSNLFGSDPSRDCYDSSKNVFRPENTSLNMSYTKPGENCADSIKASFQSEMSELDELCLQQSAKVSYKSAGLHHQFSPERSTGGDNGEGGAYNGREAFSKGGTNERDGVNIRGGVNSRGRAYGRFASGGVGRGNYKRGGSDGRGIAYSRGIADSRGGAYGRGGTRGRGGSGTGGAIATKASVRYGSTETKQKSVLPCPRGKQIACKAARKACYLGDEDDEDHDEDDDSDDDDVDDVDDDKMKEDNSIEHGAISHGSGSFEPTKRHRRSRSIDRENSERERSRSRSRSLERTSRRDRQGLDCSRSRDKWDSSDGDKEKRHSRGRSRSRSWRRSGRQENSWNYSYNGRKRSRSRSRDGHKQQGRSRSISKFQDHARDRDRTGNRYLFKLGRRSRSRSWTRSRSRSLNRSRGRSRSRSKSRSRRGSRSRFRSRSRSRSLSRSRSRSRRRSRSKSRRSSRSRSRSRSLSRSRDRSRSRSLSRSRGRSRGERQRRFSSDSRTSSQERILSLKRSRSPSFDRRLRKRNRSVERRRFRRQSYSRERGRSQSRSSFRKKTSSSNRRRSPEDRQRSPVYRQRSPVNRQSRSTGKLSRKKKVVHRSKSRSRSREEFDLKKKQGQSATSRKGSNGKQKKTKSLDKSKDTMGKTHLVKNPETGRWERKTMDDKGIDDVKADSYDESSTAVDISNAKSSVGTDETDNLWSGVVCGKIKDVELAYHDILQILGDGQAYFELTEELCSELALRRDRIIEVLEKQGIKSLGGMGLGNLITAGLNHFATLP